MACRSSFCAFPLLLLVVFVSLLLFCCPCSGAEHEANPNLVNLDGLSPELMEMIRKAQDDAKNRPQTEEEIIRKLRQEAEMKTRRAKPQQRANPREQMPTSASANRPPPKVPPQQTAEGGAAAANSRRPTRPRPDPRSDSFHDDPNVKAAKAEAERRRGASESEPRIVSDTVPPPRPGAETVEERRRLMEERKKRRENPNPKGGVRGGQYPQTQETPTKEL